MKRNIQLIIKRVFDLMFSLIVVILLFPVWFTVGVLIKLTSTGPVFFIHERPGRHMRTIRVFKFRTMRPGSEKMIKGKEVMSDDNRITPIGRYLRRFKIDEVPQFINVIKGDMSLVGPRPERMDYLDDYTDEEKQRFIMRPGLTGLAQVSGGIHIPLKERHQYDVYYVKNFSLWLDIKIIFRTIGVVLFGEKRFVRSETKSRDVSI